MRLEDEEFLENISELPEGKQNIIIAYIKNTVEDSLLAQKKKAIELFSKRFHDKQEISIEEVKQILIKNLMGVKE